MRAKVYSLISSSTGNGKELLDILNKLKGVNQSCVDMLGNIIIKMILMCYSLRFFIEYLIIVLSIRRFLQISDVHTAGYRVFCTIR